MQTIMMLRQLASDAALTMSTTHHSRLVPFDDFRRCSLAGAAATAEEGVVAASAGAGDGGNDDPAGAASVYVTTTNSTCSSSTDAYMYALVFMGAHDTIISNEMTTAQSTKFTSPLVLRSSTAGHSTASTFCATRRPASSLARTAPTPLLFRATTSPAASSRTPTAH
mgnify:CR=1 FL=1